MCSRSPGQGHSYSLGCSRRSLGGREIPARLSVRQTVACGWPTSPAISREPPARATPGGADPLLLACRQQPRRAVRPRRSILETAQRYALLERRLRPAPPPLTSGRRRNSAASRRCTTRKTAFDIADQRPPASESETRVTVKPHPGPSFDCEPSQTHSLEGGPDDLPNRPQPVQARQLDAFDPEAAQKPHEVS